jgi:hypothetical protein
MKMQNLILILAANTECHFQKITPCNLRHAVIAAIQIVAECKALAVRLITVTGGWI